MTAQSVFRAWDPETEHLRGGHECTTGGGQAPGFEAPGGLSSPSSPDSEPRTLSASSSDSTLKGSGPCSMWTPPRASSPAAFMSNVARAMHGMPGAGLAARLGRVGPSGGLFCQDPGFSSFRAPPHPIKRWHRFHAPLPNGCFSRSAGLSAGWIQCFRGRDGQEGRGLCLGTECPRPRIALSCPRTAFGIYCRL